MEEEVAYPVQGHSECDSASAQPAEAAGTCETDLCEQCAAWGCAACVPKLDSDAYVKGLWTRTEDVWVEVEQGDGYVHKFVESSKGKELEWLTGDPCDGEAACGSPPVCATEDREDAGEGYPSGAQRVTRRAYLYFHSCIVEEDIEMEVSGEALDPDEWPKPKAVDEEQIPDGLTVRGFVVAGTRTGGRRAKVAIGGGAPGDGPPGRLAFASADFLSPDMDLWHMNWRSRLVRFRMPSEEGGLSGSCSGEFAAECASVGGEADSFMGGGMSLPGATDLIIH
jgi:hypothetical protein